MRPCTPHRGHAARPAACVLRARGHRTQSRCGPLARPPLSGHARCLPAGATTSDTCEPSRREVPAPSSVSLVAASAAVSSALGVVPGAGTQCGGLAGAGVGSRLRGPGAGSRDEGHREHRAPGGRRRAGDKHGGFPSAGAGGALELAPWGPVALPCGAAGRGRGGWAGDGRAGRKRCSAPREEAAAVSF